MNLAEDLERHPKYARNVDELIQTGIDGWEETVHFQMLYGQGMLDDARNEETGELDPDKYIDLKSEFWEGYLEGRRSIGKDVYKVAKRLIAAKARKSTKPKAAKSHKPTKIQTSFGGMR